VLQKTSNLPFEVTSADILAPMAFQANLYAKENIVQVISTQYSQETQIKQKLCKLDRRRFVTRLYRLSQVDQTDVILARNQLAVRMSQHFKGALQVSHRIITGQQGIRQFLDEFFLASETPR